MTWRLPEDSHLRALTGTVVWVGNERREIVWIVSAGELLDARAHRERWKRGSAAERCSMYGGSAYWSDRD